MLNTKIKLVPFRVPSYVIIERPVRPRQDGYLEVPRFHISELDDDTLTQLCDEFKSNVFKKARESNNRK